MRDILSELQLTRSRLDDDITDKDRVLAIDRSCATGKNVAHSDYSYGFSKIGNKQRHFADTASARKRAVTLDISRHL